jgi:hypothetical protein
MLLETNQVDMAIGGFIVRVVCFLIGVGMVVAFVSNLIAWHDGDPGISNIWQALGGTRDNTPFEFHRRGFARLLFIWSPDGVLTGIFHVLFCLASFDVAIRGNIGAYLRWGFLLLWM